MSLSLFDAVLVVSLKGSSDRRRHIAQHFSQIGLTDYTFFDACGPDSSDVAGLYAAGRVAGYPPCFRCGKADCGKPDCNNVLIPAQVAVFATYLALWRHIAGTSQRVLVCEDDVLFHPWWRTGLDRIAAAVGSGDLEFSRTSPCLLRLGWALNDDHDARVGFRISSALRMSNPCHAITSPYAAALLEQFSGVSHTADVYLHSLAPISATAARTVFPPIATELSWSHGTMASLIHPKTLHADWLEAQGRHEEARRYRDHIARHVRETAHRTNAPGQPVKGPAQQIGETCIPRPLSEPEAG